MRRGSGGKKQASFRKPYAMRSMTLRLLLIPSSTPVERGWRRWTRIPGCFTSSWREVYEGGDPAADRPAVPGVRGVLRRATIPESPERLERVLEHVGDEELVIRFVHPHTIDHLATERGDDAQQAMDDHDVGAVRPRLRFEAFAHLHRGRLKRGTARRSNQGRERAQILATTPPRHPQHAVRHRLDDDRGISTPRLNREPVDHDWSHARYARRSQAPERACPTRHRRRVASTIPSGLRRRRSFGWRRTIHTACRASATKLARAYGPGRPVVAQVADTFLGWGVLKHGFAPAACTAAACSARSPASLPAPSRWPFAR